MTDEKRSGTVQGDMLKEIASRLKNPADGNFSRSAVDMAGRETNSPLQMEAMDCRYGNEIFVLPDATAVEEFLHNFPGSQSGEFSTTRTWSKQAVTGDSTYELMLEIVARLQQVEEQLRQIAAILKSGESAGRF